MRETESKIKEILIRTDNVKSFRLGIEGEIEFKAGQFLQVTLDNKPNLKRYLSISNSPTEKGYLEFTKKITESEFSQRLNTLKPYDSIRVQYPFGKFTLDESFQKIAFLAGGIGITPVRSIAKFIVDENTGTDVVILYANRRVEDIVFRDDFEKMQKEYAKLRIIHILSEATPGKGFLTGRINKEIIQENIPDYKERKFYLCGPPAMVEAMKNILLTALGLSKEYIVTENFQGY
ncbi:MAG: FAD-binding oxidoreductase [Candidatus Omnitrophica bacterium]|nr:FAD-binding oxidoreductase [Candidatus Omnitrophota bacterium]